MAELSEKEQWEMRKFQTEKEKSAYQKLMRKRDMEVAQAGDEG